MASRVHAYAEAEARRFPMPSRHETEVKFPRLGFSHTIIMSATTDVDTKTSSAVPAMSNAQVTGLSDSVTEHTTVYTNATPDVLESENHRVVTEALPITHTGVPDYNEGSRAAPPIVGSDLYSVLRSSQPVSQTPGAAATKTAGAAPMAPATTSTATAFTSSDKPSDVAAPIKTVNGAEDATGSLSTKPTAPATTSNVHAGTAGAATGAATGAGVGAGTTASQGASAPSSFEPTNEQAWSVRGPASNYVSRGPIDIAAVATAGATGASTSGLAAESSTGVANPTTATDATTTGATGATGATGVAGATGATTKPTTAATNAAQGVKGTSTNATTGVNKAGQNAATGAKDTATKKKVGVMTKIKRALKIGKNKQ